VDDLRPTHIKSLRYFGRADQVVGVDHASHVTRTYALVAWAR
jgi:hypothetical protein